MIKSYKNAATRKVHESGRPKGFKGLDGEMAADRLDDLAAAKSIADISPLASIHLHKLKGGRKKEWAITINGPWRICFMPTPDGFENVKIEDYH